MKFMNEYREAHWNGALGALAYLKKYLMTHTEIDIVIYIIRLIQMFFLH